MIKAAGFRYIPKGAIKVADKNSDAVAYLYQTARGEPAVQVYFGKQSKPVLRCYFLNARNKSGEQQRVDRIGQLFIGRQMSAAVKAERAAKRKAAPRKIEAGAFFYTSWGYDQTNIDWYMVTKLIGKTMLEVVEVSAMDASKGDEGYMQGKSVPSDQPKGQPFRVRANGDSFKVNGRYSAYLWDGQPKSWTSYA